MLRVSHAPINHPHPFLPWPLLLSPSGPIPSISPFSPLSLKTLSDSYTRSHPHSTVFCLSLGKLIFRMRNQVEERFSEFYEKWVWKLEQILHQLLEVSKHRSHVVLVTEQDLQALVSTVTAHLKEYYTVKWATAREDVLAFYTPVWMSPLENAYAWVTGWKPSTVFRLLDSLRKPPPVAEGPSTFNLTEEQQRKVEELRMKVRLEEEKVEREMERLQVAMADRKMVELAKLSSRVWNGHGTVAQVDGLVEVAFKGVLGGLEKIMKGADCVRLKTLKGVLDVLTPMQCVEFLAATLTLQLRLRQWGKKRDMAASKHNEDK